MEVAFKLDIESAPPLGLMRFSWKPLTNEFKKVFDQNLPPRLG